MISHVKQVLLGGFSDRLHVGALPRRPKVPTLALATRLARLDWKMVRSGPKKNLTQWQLVLWRWLKASLHEFEDGPPFTINSVTRIPTFWPRSVLTSLFSLVQFARFLVTCFVFVIVVISDSWRPNLLCLHLDFGREKNRLPVSVVRFALHSNIFW